MTPEAGFGGRPAAAPTVVELRARGREADRTEVVLSDERSFTIATEAVLVLGLSREAPIDAHLEARLVEADLRFRARDLVLRALTRRAHSRRELKDRLRRKEFPARLIGEVLDELEAVGLVDDRAFAEAYVRDRVRLRPRGRRALVAELARKGVRDDADDAIEAVFEDEGVSERALAREVAEGWLRRQPHTVLAGLAEGFGSKARERALRRYLGFMGRRGFGAGLAREVLDDGVLDELDPPGSTTSEAGGRRV
ncbi:MAG: regulatory protein RecX [Longimicrobiales bacterium]|nr:regulatory protein RecX [Longimicrobiales bacterium]